MAIPLPKATPFDHTPRLRTAYLEFYARGYEFAATSPGYASLGCACESEGDDERYDAMVNGFYAGRAAGAAAYAAKHMR